MTLRHEVMKYINGFLYSLVLTLSAYMFTVNRVFEGSTLLIVLGVLALLQMGIQLVFFLHLGEEKQPRLKALAFGFMALILIIIVVGTLWIMNHLNYRMMDLSPQQKDDYMTMQKDKGF